MLKEYISNSEQKITYGTILARDIQRQPDSVGFVGKRHLNVTKPSIVRIRQSTTTFQRFSFPTKTNIIPFDIILLRVHLRLCALFASFGIHTPLLWFLFTSFQLINRCGFDVFYQLSTKYCFLWRDIDDFWDSSLRIWREGDTSKLGLVLCFIGNVFLENTSLGQKIDLAIKINAPQQPIPLEQIYCSFQLRLPASFSIPSVVSKQIEELDVSLLQAQRNVVVWKIWGQWLDVWESVVFCINERGCNETNPLQSFSSKYFSILYCTANHPFLISLWNI